MTVFVAVVQGHESISLRATALVGNIDLYVMKCPFQSSECAGTHTDGSTSYLPNTAHYEFTTAGQSDDFVTVTRNDDEPVSYIVGVSSDSMYAEYHISMSQEHSILALSPGTPVIDHAEEGEYDYFSVFAEDGPQVLNIQLTPLAGDVDLFVSTIVTRPNISSNTWQSRLFGEDSIAIDTELDDNACTGCTYFISVYGYRAGSYRYCSICLDVCVRDGFRMLCVSQPNGGDEVDDWSAIGWRAGGCHSANVILSEIHIQEHVWHRQELQGDAHRPER